MGLFEAGKDLLNRIRNYDSLAAGCQELLGEHYYKNYGSCYGSCHGAGRQVLYICKRLADVHARETRIQGHNMKHHFLIGHMHLCNDSLRAMCPGDASVAGKCREMGEKLKKMSAKCILPSHIARVPSHD